MGLKSHIKKQQVNSESESLGEHLNVRFDNSLFRQGATASGPTWTDPSSSAVWLDLLSDV